MKDEQGNFRDDAEPSVRQGAVYLPMWIIGLLAFLIYWGFSYIDAHGSYNELVYEPYHSTNQLASFRPTDETAAQMMLGKQRFERFCAVCHQSNGGGNPAQAPPLAGSEWVLAEGPNRIIRIPIVGLNGPIKAAGKEFNGSMASVAIAGVVSDEELAAVLTYIRNSWGNSAPRVTVEQVQRVRADLKDRTDQYTVEEILKVPEAVQ
jgi:mono/diheme cytochrome c family protein